MDNYFSSPDLHDNLTEQKINCCNTVRLNCKGKPDDFSSKTLKTKWGNIWVRTSGAMTAVVRKDKCDMHMLTNIHDANIAFNVKKPHICFRTKLSISASICIKNNGQNSAIKVSYKGI
jgi:hypothetical protein